MNFSQRGEMMVRGSHSTWVVGGLVVVATSLFSAMSTLADENPSSPPGTVPVQRPAHGEGSRPQGEGSRPQGEGSRRGADAGRSGVSDADVPRVRLQYISATWDKVLNDLSSKTGSALIVHDLPPGRFSRNDFKKYSRAEAVRILNQQLEPKGYRILEKDRYLTVLAMHQARSTYRRPVSPVTATQARAEASAAAGTGGDGQSPQLLSDPQQAASRPVRKFDSITDGLKRNKGSRPTRGSGPSRIVQTSHTDVSADAVGIEGEAAPVEHTFRPQHRTAGDLARLMRASFRNRSELLDLGPHDLPALQVFDRPLSKGQIHASEPAAGAHDVWFTVEIDTDKNTLFVTAADQTTRGLITLMQRLDVPASADQPAARLVTASPEMLHIGRQLQPELKRFQQKVAGGRRPWRGSDVAGEPPHERGPLQLAGQVQPGQRGQEPPPASQPQQPGGQVPQQDSLPAILNALRGDVTLETLEDLNLLILRGNEQDVEQVMQVIREIERLAAGSRPEIHLLFLEHVNSVALAELLNNLYDELEDLRNVAPLQGAQAVNVVPVGTPNAVLILAPQAAMESILQLARELDQPGDPQAEIEIFSLRSAVASQAKATIDEFYAEPANLAPRVRVSADVRTNSLIVHARPRDLAQVRLMIRRIDGTSKAANQLKVIQLQHAAADELSEFLNTTIQGILNPPTQTAGAGGFGAAPTQGAQELRDPKSVVLEFLTTDGTMERLVRSGLLTDVRVTADLRTNSITVVAPKQTLELLVELIAILDQPSATVADIKVFTLENADATTAVELLTELFSSDQEDALGIAIAGAEDASSSLIPLKFSFDTRTNTVVAIGGAEALVIVEAILLRLDESNVRQRRQEVMKLNNSPAIEVAQAINDFMNAQLQVAQLDAEQVSTKELIDQTFIVVPNEYTNTLLISASPRYYDDLVRMAKELDAKPPQVMMQALIIEVELDDTDEFGIELGFQDSVLFNRSITTAEDLLTIETSTSNPGTGVVTTTQSIISQAATPGFAFNNQPLGNNIAGSPSKVGAQGLSNFALGRTNGELGFGGLVLSAGSESVSVLVRALEARRDVRVLSRPQVTALDNQIARIQLGQVVPVINGFTPPADGFAATPLVQPTDVGIILEVVPQINPAGQVVMNVSAQKSALSGAGVPLFVDGNTGATIEAPIIDIAIAETRVMVNDGQTIVLGGMIVEEDITLERKVPWLGDVPILGQLFRYDANNHRRAELIVFLTPRIIYNDADFELIKQVETERLHFFEHEAEEIHGPLFGVPPAGGFRFEDPQACEPHFAPPTSEPQWPHDDPQPTFGDPPPHMELPNDAGPVDVPQDFFSEDN